jgi:hypothetical protein
MMVSKLLLWQTTRKPQELILNIPVEHTNVIPIEDTDNLPDTSPAPASGTLQLQQVIHGKTVSNDLLSNAEQQPQANNAVQEEVTTYNAENSDLHTQKKSPTKQH